MRRYGRGAPEVLDRCVAEVFFFCGRGARGAAQCSRKRGYGTRGEFCRQHDSMILRGRDVIVPMEASDAV